MTISLVRTLQTADPVTQQNHGDVSQQEAELLRSSYCTLQWRQGQLLVKSSHKPTQPHIPALENQQLLIDCLKHSPIKLVSVDPKIGETCLKFWAEACEKAHKPMYLSGYFRNQLFIQNKQPWRWFIRFIDLIAALVLLLLLSPVILVLVLLLQLSMSRSLFSYEWYVGKRGKIFRAIKFSNTKKHTVTLLDNWMLQSSLNYLPQLWNVLRGNTSFIGHRCWTLTAVVRLSSECQKQINQLPAISSSWGIPSESQLITHNY